MRLPQSERVRRLIRRLPQGSPLAWVEMALIVGLGVQLARLLWALATPVGAFGDWRPRLPVELPAVQRAALFAGFDPFFRANAAPGGLQAVTGLALTLFGTSINEASGRGGAIIASPEGVQQSFGVGDEVMPGVRLKEVALDHVVLTHGQQDESLFLDQSRLAAVAGAGPARAPVPPVLPQFTVPTGAAAPPMALPASTAPPPPPSANSSIPSAPPAPNTPPQVTQ